MGATFRRVLLGLLAVGLLGLPQPAEAQFGKLKDRVTKKVEKKVEKKAEDAVDKQIDDVLDPKQDTDEQKQSKEPAPQQSTATTKAGDATETAQLKPGEGAWANYDFVPGDRVLYFADFEKSPIGDFPERLEFEKGNMEIVEWQGSHFLRMPTHSDFKIPLPEVLPDRFTVEFDLYLPDGVFKMYGPAADRSSPSAHSLVQFAHGSGGVHGSGGGESKVKLPGKVWEGIVHCRLMGYGKYLKVYVNETRVANVPNADFIRTNKLHVNLYNFSQAGVLIDNIRVAEGGKIIMYDQLTANGRVTTQGIYFDSGGDRIRPESTPTLKQMGRMLQDHGELKLLIEGHTDNVGEDSFNQTLSDQRAAAVKAFLVTTYQIDEARLQTKGLGETKPIDSNGTPEGRQNNRRVELVKL